MESSEFIYRKQYIAIGIVVFLFILILFLIGFVYLQSLERSTKDFLELNTEGNPCTGQTCGVGFYCDGNGSCRSGNGEGIGQSCGKDADCTFGLICLTETKTCGTNSGNVPVSNQTEIQLVTTSTGSKQYLVIDQNGSFLSSAKPSDYSFDYSSSRGLSFNSVHPVYHGKYVGFSNDGRMNISVNGEPKLQLIQNGLGEIRLVNTICQNSSGGQPLYSGLNVVQQIPFSDIDSSKPFLTFFPTPTNNSVSRDPCPTSWMNTNNANVISFDIESNFN